MEVVGSSKSSETSRNFNCEICQYTTSHKNNFTKHCQTIKHRQCGKNGHFSNLEIAKVAARVSNDCDKCNRSFGTSSGLWKHKRTCKTQEETRHDELLNVIMKQNDIIMQSHNSFVKKDEDIRNLVVELCKNLHPISNQNSNNVVSNCAVNSNNNSNNNNKTFNLQFFLNETCKDALNLSEFIQTVKSSFEDIEAVGTMGYVDGTSNMIIRHLNELGVEKRPIQCTDAKRQTLYIKENNQWTKEDNTIFRHMQILVDEVQKINLRILPQWQKAHPNCLTSNSKFTDTYNHMSQELMGGECQKVKLHVKDHRIFNRIIKEVVIDKHMFIY